MGGGSARCNEGNLRAGPALLIARSKTMTEDREKISTGPNAEPLDENIAGTAPGIPDDSLAPGEDELPPPPTDEQVKRAAEALGAPQAEEDSLPLDGE
jgi:hypothetical protein